MKEEKTLEEKNQEQKNQTLHNIMKEFDIYKWNSERRLAAINEGIEEAKDSKYDKYLDVVIKHLEDSKYGSEDLLSYLKRMRNYITMDMQRGDLTFEGAMDRDQIAQKMFGKVCADLDAEQLEKVDTEYKKDTHNK